ILGFSVMILNFRTPAGKGGDFFIRERKGMSLLLWGVFIFGTFFGIDHGFFLSSKLFGKNCFFVLFQIPFIDIKLVSLHNSTNNVVPKPPARIDKHHVIKAGIWFNGKGYPS